VASHLPSEAHLSISLGINLEQRALPMLLTKCFLSVAGKTSIVANVVRDIGTTVWSILLV